MLRVIEVNYIDSSEHIFFLIPLAGGAFEVVGQLMENGGNFNCPDREAIAMAMIEGGILGAISGVAGFGAGVRGKSSLHLYKPSSSASLFLNLFYRWLRAPQRGD